MLPGCEPTCIAGVFVTPVPRGDGMIRVGMLITSSLPRALVPVPLPPMDREDLEVLGRALCSAPAALRPQTSNDPAMALVEQTVIHFSNTCLVVQELAPQARAGHLAPAAPLSPLPPLRLPMA